MKPMDWRTWGIGLGLVLLTGCVSPLDRPLRAPPKYVHSQHLTASIELPREPAPIQPSPSEAFLEISTVLSPKKAHRPISVAECICLALENGRTGENFDRAGGDRSTSATGTARSTTLGGSTDSLRVFVLDPAIVQADIEQSLARFDVMWRVLTSWNHVDSPNGIPIDQVPRLGVLNDQIETGSFRSEFLKPLPTGGVAGVGVRFDGIRSKLTSGSTLMNPAYLPGVDVSFEQPLWQGAGVFLNQIRDTFPTSVKQPIPSRVAPQGTPGILLARINHQMAQYELERRLQELVLVVNQAYWELYGAYWELYSRDNGIEQAQIAWQIAKSRYDHGFIGIEDLAQAEEQYHAFRTQRLEALGRGTPGRAGILEAERRLRYILGLPAEDGCRLIPIDEPESQWNEPDWSLAVIAARSNRPELKQIQKEVQAAELLVLRAQDLTRPDVRFFARYGINGLDGNFSAAYDKLGNVPFSNWEMGIQAEMPIGFRAAHAEVTRTKLQLQQRHAYWKDQEEKVLTSLQRSYRDLVQLHQELQTRKSQREAAAVQVKARYQKFQTGKESIDLLLRSQRNWADNLRDEYQAISRFNVALADFERQKGTILDHYQIRFANGPISPEARENASTILRQSNHERFLPRVGGPQLGNPVDPGSVEALGVPNLLDPSHEKIVGYVTKQRAAPGSNPHP